MAWTKYRCPTSGSHRQGLCTEYNIRGPTVCASDLRITSPNSSPSIMLYATTVVWDFESFLYIEAWILSVSVQHSMYMCFVAPCNFRSWESTPLFCLFSYLITPYFTPNAFKCRGRHVKPTRYVSWKSRRVRNMTTAYTLNPSPPPRKRKAR